MILHHCDRLLEELDIYMLCYFQQIRNLIYKYQVTGPDTGVLTYTKR